MDKYLRIAYRIVEEHDDSDFHKLAALVVRGGAVVSSGVNLSRQGRCAERRALRPNQDFEGCTLYVVRANGRISKPCKNCMKAINESGVKWVVYINADQKAEVMRVGY